MWLTFETIETSYSFHPFSIFPVALQNYRVVVHEEQVVVGNDVILKCVIPSFEADFVSVGSWIDSEGVEYPVNYEMGNKTHMTLDAENRIEIYFM